MSPCHLGQNTRYKLGLCENYGALAEAGKGKEREGSGTLSSGAKRNRPKTVFQMSFPA